MPALIVPLFADGAVVRVVPPRQQVISVVPVAGPPGPPGGTFTATAAVGITTGQVIALTSAGAIPANPTNIGHRWLSVGVATSSAAAGGSLTACSAGRIIPGGAWIAGSPIYAGLAGALTHTPVAAGWLRVLGFAETTNTVFLKIQPTINLA